MKVTSLRVTRYLLAVHCCLVASEKVHTQFTWLPLSIFCLRSLHDISVILFIYIKIFDIRKVTFIVFNVTFIF
ncbi:hypothetical protein V1478_001701 [Vespula squamosa]|uniref:Secreted protein n=1 Tax=Vespula squamosa TaxID=30214 RepID=A0ABD2BXW2_VESSQ